MHIRLLFLALLAFTTWSLDDDARSKARAELRTIATEANRLSRAFNLVHEIVGPSVVTIGTRERVYNPWSGRSVREVEVGEGSGFVFHSDEQSSWVLTNAHVVLQTDKDQNFSRTRDGKWVGYDRLRVTLNDNREADAEYVGADVQSDLAVIKVAIPRLPAVEWADSDQIHVGDWVVALGYPLGVGYSATAGIVSATDKSTGVYEAVGGFESFIQTDAAINPGNSGGPLVDLGGRIAGVNSNIRASVGGTNLGLGFAIPANLAKRVAEDLLNGGRVRRPIVGIQMNELAADEAHKLGLPPAQALRIAEVLPMTPAAEGGIATGDVILAIDQFPIRSQQQFRSRIAARRPGEAVTLRLWHDGKTIEKRIVLASYDDLEGKLATAAKTQAARGIALPGFGLRLAADGGEGLAVTGVDPGTVADQADLAPGDRILQERTLGALKTAEDAARLAERREIVVKVLKDNRSFWLRMRR